MPIGNGGELEVQRVFLQTTGIIVQNSHAFMAFQLKDT